MHVRDTNVVFLQLEAADSDESLRQVFDDSEHELVMLETGCKKVLSMLTLSDRASLQATLKAHLLLRVKAELDQFAKGLTMCGILDSIRKHPMVMAPYFVRVPLDLSAGVTGVTFKGACIWEERGFGCCSSAPTAWIHVPNTEQVRQTWQLSDQMAY